MIGFQKAIPRVNVGAGSQAEWWSIEEKIERIRVDDNSETAPVVTLVLGEDNVSCLGGCTDPVKQLLLCLFLLFVFFWKWLLLCPVCRHDPVLRTRARTVRAGHPPVRYEYAATFSFIYLQLL
jgi:hypothetical protein